MLNSTGGETGTGFRILAAAPLKDYIVFMDTMNVDTGQAPSVETDAERQARIAWEAEGIAEARASVAAGYYATSAEVKAWIDSLGTEQPLPVPYPDQPRPR